MRRTLLALLLLVPTMGVAKAQDADGGGLTQQPLVNDGYWDVMNRGQTQSRFLSTYFTQPREWRNDRAAERAVLRRNPHLIVPREWPANRLNMRRGVTARG